MLFFVVFVGQGRDFSQVWIDHLADESVRRQYAKSMHQLASKYWEGGAENCRVEWCYETLKNYFSNSISQHIEKDLRIACFEIDAKSDTSIENEQILSEFKRNLDEFPEKSSCNSIKEVRDSFRSEKDSAKIAQLTKQGGELLFGSAFSKPEFHEAKKLLDVGSCYNPFSQLNDCNLEVVAVDLTPASKVSFGYLLIDKKHI